MYIIEGRRPQQEGVSDYHFYGLPHELAAYRARMLESALLDDAPLRNSIHSTPRRELSSIILAGAEVVPARFVRAFNVAALATRQLLGERTRLVDDAFDAQVTDPTPEAREALRQLLAAMATGVEEEGDDTIRRVNYLGLVSELTATNGMAVLAYKDIEGMLGDHPQALQAVSNLQREGFPINAWAESVSVAWQGGKPGIGDGHIAVGHLDDNGNFEKAYTFPPSV